MDFRANKIRSICPVMRTGHPGINGFSEPLFAHAWRGVFKKVQTVMSYYSDKLADPRWQRKRLEILQAANFRCEDCGRGDIELQVHHCAYLPGKKTWEHDVSLLMCVCVYCHANRQNREDAIRVSLGRIMRHLPPAQLETEAWNMVRKMSMRETERLAGAFSDEGN
jgi:hypothetical protein